MEGFIYLKFGGECNISVVSAFVREKDEDGIFEDARAPKFRQEPLQQSIRRWSWPKIEKWDDINFNVFSQTSGIQIIEWNWKPRSNRG